MSKRPTPPKPGSRPAPGGVPRPMTRADFDRKGRAYERIKQKTGYICEECRRQCKRPGNPADANAPAYLIVHQDGNARNFDDGNLWLVCERCYHRRHTIGR
jgi:hypothetical protein